ncbi:GNAT family N-acetyltransferase [Nocardia sp. NPDC050413]|uniref:GNAT family N-acetyltransferase n=1 Tax=Nocardia sp. NPDC050413 TaxID=3155784 RepID=UPI0033DAAA20
MAHRVCQDGASTNALACRRSRVGELDRDGLGRGGGCRTRGHGRCGDACSEQVDATSYPGNGEIRRAGTPGTRLLVLETRSDDALIGGANVDPDDNDASSRTLGWWIGSQDRRAGYASEAVAALVEAIHNAGFATVEIGTNESNLAVQRISPPASVRRKRTVERRRCRTDRSSR